MTNRKLAAAGQSWGKWTEVSAPEVVESFQARRAAINRYAEGLAASLQKLVLGAEEAAMPEWLERKLEREAEACANAERAAEEAQRDALERYADELYAKQPRELAKRARQARIENARAHWKKVKAFMRPLVAQGLATEKVLDQAEVRFGKDERETLRRWGLTGLRKELKKAKSVP